MKPQQPDGCEDFIKPRNAAAVPLLQFFKNPAQTQVKAGSSIVVVGRKNCRSGADARRGVKMKPQQPDGCEDFIKPRNAAAVPLLQFFKNPAQTQVKAGSSIVVVGRKNCRSGADARRGVKMKPQQPDGCEDFIKPRNEAAVPLLQFFPYAPKLS